MDRHTTFERVAALAEIVGINLRDAELSGQTDSEIMSGICALLEAWIADTRAEIANNADEEETE